MKPVASVKRRIPKWRSAFLKRLLMGELQFRIRMLKLKHSMCASQKNVPWKNLLKRSNKPILWDSNEQVEELSRGC
jgi:hypothetical protein